MDVSMEPKKLALASLLLQAGQYKSRHLSSLHKMKKYFCCHLCGSNYSFIQFLLTFLRQCALISCITTSKLKFQTLTIICRQCNPTGPMCLKCESTLCRQIIFSSFCSLDTQSSMCCILSRS